ncbi:MAG: hypothetical protein D6814_06185 [Calditrichaeota bacterium]|nr:MAG: hypothetical protein D6814_06185 [Calditrichota bacterium]
MAKLIVVENDVVSGVDKHSVYGTNNSSGSPVMAQFSYDFSGKVVEKSGGNDFVTIAGKIVITKGNNECPQMVDHMMANDKGTDPVTFETWSSSNAPAGFGFVVGGAPLPNEPDNNGENNSDAGSSFVTIEGAPVILDGDPFDTCNAVGTSNSGRAKNSTVEASNQDFVTVSE